jgi:hypothetical protein
MTIHQYLMQAVQEDARRAGERDRLLLEARRTRKARCERPDPAAIMTATIKAPASRPVRRRRRFPAPIAVGVALVLAVTAALIFIMVWRGLALVPDGHWTGTRTVPHAAPGPFGS